LEYEIQKYINELEERKSTVGLTEDEYASLEEYKGRIISLEWERDYLNGEARL
jgi:uncharacterized protein YnzC (UPF0291/DUF896 family)